MNIVIIPKKQLSMPLSCDFYQEFNLIPQARSIGKTFKNNDDQYQLLLKDSQKFAKIKQSVNLKERLNSFSTKLVKKISSLISNLISAIANLPIIRDILDICKFLFSSRNFKCRR